MITILYSYIEENLCRDYTVNYSDIKDAMLTTDIHQYDSEKKNTFHANDKIACVFIFLKWLEKCRKF